MDEEYERILLVKPDVFIYKIPARTSNRAHRASDWKLDEPDWTGRLKLVNKGDQCILKIEDKASGKLFAKCPIDCFPGPAFETVSDSSRYFVIKIQDDNGRSAFIGIGFADRGDSFDLRVALQDHFKLVEKHKELEKKENEIHDQPKLDLKFKEGQTIKVNLNIAKKGSASSNPLRQKARPKSESGLSGLLPPPPGTTRGSGQTQFKQNADFSTLLSTTETTKTSKETKETSFESCNFSNSFTEKKSGLNKDLPNFDQLNISQSSKADRNPSDFSKNLDKNSAQAKINTSSEHSDWAIF